MIAVMNRIPVNPEYAEAFEARFADRSSLVDQMPGFVSYRLLRPTNPDESHCDDVLGIAKPIFKRGPIRPNSSKGHARAGQLPREAFRIGRNSKFTN